MWQNVPFGLSRERLALFFFSPDAQVWLLASGGKGIEECHPEKISSRFDLQNFWTLRVLGTFWV